MARSSLKPEKVLRKVSISVSLESEEATLELLGRMFGQAPSFYSNAETGEQVATVYLQKKSDWSRRAEQELRAGLQYLQECGLDIGPGKISVESVRKEDWAESWKKHFKPMEIGRSLLIRPSWIKRKLKKGQKEIILDPGLSFGTGQHATTKFCLEQLAACRRDGTKQAFLDIGTGSGILAIAAAKLGYGPVEAFDFDPEAVRVAKANAEQNSVLANVRLSRKDLTKIPLSPIRPFDVVCANLIFDLLLEQKARIINRLKPGGHLLLAGILQTQFGDIRSVYEQAGLRMITHQVEKEWESGAFTKAS
jgi:ribosomal protein L11 methyltransferase